MALMKEPERVWNNALGRYEDAPVGGAVVAKSGLLSGDGSMLKSPPPPLPPTFKHLMNARVELQQSGEVGLVVGRAEYLNCSEPSYLVRYKAADGRLVEQWWGESALA